MSTSVLIACELNEQKLPPFVLLEENSGADASFLIATLIGSCLKYQSNGVVLICLHQVSQHYANAAARLGMNIGLARDKGRIVIIEPLADIGQNSLASKYLTEPKETVLDSLLENIKTEIEQQLTTKENVTLITDNIVALVDFGFPRNLVLQFVHKLINLGSKRISIILKINTSDLYEDFITSLEDYADSNYLITKMKSGEFHEVDGKIIYKKRSGIKHISKTILYKVADKNIKIFQPGEIGVRK